MAAPKGNKFWELRSSHGVSPMFKAPEDLWAAACEYFEYADSTPIQEERIFNFQGEVIIGAVGKMRAMTQAALCLYLDISEDALRTYKKKEGFIKVTKKIEAVIYSNKFEGASAGLLNPNIIARDLGLVDKVESKDTTEEISDDDINERILELMGKAAK